MKRAIKLGTRASKLAMAQTELVAERVRALLPEAEVELVPITTKGDKILHKTLDQIGGKGLFIKELEEALLAGTIDAAVHSMKDMPANLPEGLRFAAVLEREDPRDAFVSKGPSFWELPPGAKIGTGSLRRKEQLLALRSDVVVQPIRGNVITRLSKLETEFDGIVLAAAGLKRLGMEEAITHYFELEQMVPAACQGILALESADERLCQLLINRELHACALAERAFLAGVEGSCHLPVGAISRVEGGVLTVKGYYKGRRTGKRQVSGKVEQAAALGDDLARLCLDEAN